MPHNKGSRVNTGTFRIKKNPYAQPPSVDSSPADEVAYNDNPLVSSFSRPDTEQVRRGSQASGVCLSNHFIFTFSKRFLDVVTTLSISKYYILKSYTKKRWKRYPLLFQQCWKIHFLLYQNPEICTLSYTTNADKYKLSNAKIA